ncbi:hypothetical protein ILYODFUR_018288 [Ilyodon furcidens]|uniref:Uncharacterized protein n=1 Tax=Ilyodon furcidens TaxID=33524 RepID=A0ABV0U700_9TELE
MLYNLFSEISRLIFKEAQPIASNQRLCSSPHPEQAVDGWLNQGANFGAAPRNEEDHLQCLRTGCPSRVSVPGSGTMLCLGPLRLLDHLRPPIKCGPIYPRHAPCRWLTPLPVGALLVLSIQSWVIRYVQAHSRRLLGGVWAPWLCWVYAWRRCAVGSRVWIHDWMCSIVRAAGWDCGLAAEAPWGLYTVAAGWFPRDTPLLFSVGPLDVCVSDLLHVCLGSWGVTLWLRY